MQKSCLNYPVEIIEDSFGNSPALADALRKASGLESPQVFIVADASVVRHTPSLGVKIGRYMREHDLALAAPPMVVAGGERVKADRMESIFSTISAMVAAKLRHDDIVLALGGGAVLDVAGYAAAQIRGGVKLIRMPTTPAAMMDGAYADYAALDWETVKDALRVPSQPAAVVIDPQFATTVLDVVWCAGIGAALRQAVGADATLFKQIVAKADGYAARDPAIFAELVAAVSKSVIKKGLSQFARWAPPRLEAMSDYRLPSDAATLSGIVIDLGYAVEKGMLSDNARKQVMAVMERCELGQSLAQAKMFVELGSSLIFGLDAWAVASGNAGVALPTAIGKCKAETSPDRETYKLVFEKMTGTKQ